MLLTAPLLSKSSFFGSLLNKCRQVLPTKKPSNIQSNNNIKNNNNFTPTTHHPTTDTDTTKTIAADDDHHNANLHRPTAKAAKSLDHGVAQLSLSSPLSASSTAKSLEEKVGLPPRPKKPLTPYFRFLGEMRPKVVTANPQMKNIDVVRLISKQWETTDISVKERLQNEYKKEQQVYVEQRAKYDSKISDEQRAEIKQLRHDMNEAKERRVLRRRIKELGRPKRPASAFLRFISEERQKNPQTAKQTYREWHDKATARWTRLKDSEKQVYMDAVRGEMEKHRKELAAWEEKMIRLGHVDVVRQGNLIDIPETKARK